jgi:hypothetical protein
VWCLRGCNRLDFKNWKATKFSAFFSGVGGVGLFPMLIILGVTADYAVRSIFCSFLLPALIASALYYHAGHLRLDLAVSLWVGCIPGAVSSTFILSLVSSAGGSLWVALGISSVAILSGLWTFKSVVSNKLAKVEQTAQSEAGNIITQEPNSVETTETPIPEGEFMGPTQIQAARITVELEASKMNAGNLTVKINLNFIFVR